MPALRIRPVVYNSPAVIHFSGGGAFREFIAPGALTEALKRSVGVVCLRDHDPSRLLARSPGTLAFRDTPTHLDAVADLPATEAGHEVRVAVERRDLAGASFAFSVADESWHEAPDSGPPIRVVREVARLFDVSPCTFPAYSATSLGSKEGRYLAHRPHRIVSGGSIS